MASDNVKQAYVMFNGQKTIATYDPETDLWAVELTAPGESSWGQPNHVYLIEIYAEDLAGNTAFITSTNPTYGDQLKIRVLEKTEPVVTFSKPTQNAVLGSSEQEIKGVFYDLGGSGINESSIKLSVNDIIVEDWSFVEKPESDQGNYEIRYIATGLSDGYNSAKLYVSDNDGNEKTASVSFVISTAAPLLEVFTPTDELITNATTVSVTGIASPSSEYTSIVEVTVNDNLATVESDGSFSYDLQLGIGENQIAVTAKDSVGKTTTIYRNVTVDTDAPVISEVHAESTTVDASGIIRITFRVTDS